MQHSLPVIHYIFSFICPKMQQWEHVEDYLDNYNSNYTSNNQKQKEYNASICCQLHICQGQNASVHHIHHSEILVRGQALVSCILMLHPLDCRVQKSFSLWNNSLRPTHYVSPSLATMQWIWELPAFIPMAFQVDCWACMLHCSS